MTGAEILVIGDVMTDIIVRPEGLPARGTDRRATIRAMPGGSGANVAAWLARLGVAVAFAGRVGAPDHAAQSSSLHADGVVTHVAADPDAPTGTLVTLIDPDGEHSFLTARGANTRLTRADLPDRLLDGLRAVHISGYTLFEPGPRAAVLDFIAAASARRIAISIDVASTAFLQETGPAKFLDWTRGAAICFANAAEATLLSGTRDPDTQLDALAPLFGLIVIKRGAAGAVAARGRERWSAPANDVRVIDTSGAGDAFDAGFLAAWLRGEAPSACLTAGTALGARAVTQLGGRPIAGHASDIG